MIRSRSPFGDQCIYPTRTNGNWTTYPIWYYEEFEWRFEWTQTAEPIVQTSKQRSYQQLDKLDNGQQQWMEELQDQKLQANIEEEIRWGQEETMTAARKWWREVEIHLVEHQEEKVKAEHQWNKAERLAICTNLQHAVEENSSYPQQSENSIKNISTRRHMKTSSSSSSRI